MESTSKLQKEIKGVGKSQGGFTTSKFCFIGQTRLHSDGATGFVDEDRAMTATLFESIKASDTSSEYVQSTPGADGGTKFFSILTINLDDEAENLQVTPNWWGGRTY